MTHLLFRNIYSRSPQFFVPS